MCRFADAAFQASVTSCHPPLPSPNTLRKYVRCHQKGGVPGLLDSTPTGMYLSRALPPRCVPPPVTMDPAGADENNKDSSGGKVPVPIRSAGRLTTTFIGGPILMGDLTRRSLSVGSYVTWTAQHFFRQSNKSSHGPP